MHRSTSEAKQKRINLNNSWNLKSSLRIQDACLLFLSDQIMFRPWWPYLSKILRLSTKKTLSKHWLGASKWSRWSIRQIRLPSLYPFEGICLPMWGGLRWKQCLRHWWREPSMVGETIVTPDRWSISCLPRLSALAACLCRLQLQLQSPSRGKGVEVWIHRCQCGNLLCKIGSFAPLHAYPQHSIEEVSRQHSCKRPGTPPQKQWAKTSQTTAEGRVHCLRKKSRGSLEHCAAHSDASKQ